MMYYKVCFEMWKGVLRSKEKCIPKLMVEIGHFPINSGCKGLTEEGSEFFFSRFFDFFDDSGPFLG